jgi:uracil-DNA glycosylase family 4
VALELDNRQRAMLQEMGVRVWMPGTAFALQAGEPQRPVNPVAVVAVASTPARDVVPTPVVPRVPPSQPAAGTTPLNLEKLGWQALADSAANCQACGLCAGRKQSTLQAPTETSQPMQADWFFVGDPPDEDEDREGQAFAGQAGQLLDNMLKAMGARRGEAGASGAYVTTIVKCRPPGARLPQADELAQCAAYLQRELVLVRPKVIVAMGRFAIAQLLGENASATALPLGKQRGTVYRYQGVPVVVTYAPKVLLRASADKAKAWADLCLALDVRDGLV